MIIITNYIHERKQGIKVNIHWNNITYGFPQWSILSPLPFKIRICNIFKGIDTDIAA